MKNLDIIIVDDEQHCIETLLWQLKTYCPECLVVATFNNPTEALTALNSTKIDLLLLDIDMPHLNGFELLEKLGAFNFDVIFTTAFDQFALRAIKISALDYLIKPIDEDELVIAIQKAKSNQKQDQEISIKHLLNQINQHVLSDRIFLPSIDGLDFVETSTIIRCESDSNYTTLFLANNTKKIVSKTLKEIEEMLSDQQFFRTHHSHIVNLKKIMRYVKGDGGHLVMNNSDIVTVSRARKQNLLDIIKQ